MVDLFKQCEMCLNVSIPGLTKHGSVPSPKQLSKSTQLTFVYIFPTPVKFCIRKGWKNKVVAEHFTFRGCIYKAMYIKAKKKSNLYRSTTHI